MVSTSLTVLSHVSKLTRGSVVIIYFLSLGSKTLLIFVPIPNVPYTLKVVYYNFTVNRGETNGSSFKKDNYP